MNEATLLLREKRSMKNILILDDNQDILNALNLGLCACLKDCTVMTALSGVAGWEILKTMPIDLILTDLDMPSLKRYWFIEQMRKEHPSVPVCVMTDTKNPEVAERLSLLGVAKVIAKPFLVEDLASMVTEQLNRGQHPS
jgi:DNA-binding NtrC family response regulator